MDGTDDRESPHAYKQNISLSDIDPVKVRLTGTPC